MTPFEKMSREALAAAFSTPAHNALVATWLTAMERMFPGRPLDVRDAVAFFDISLRALAVSGLLSDPHVLAMLRQWLDAQAADARKRKAAKP